MISRRAFLVVTTGALVAPPICWPAEDVPDLLDHILLECEDLDAGIAFVEERTGVRAAYGGVHPGRGKRNALLSLGERRYFEVIALDPAQASAQPVAHQSGTIEKGRKPHLSGWAVHPPNIERLAEKLRAAGVATEARWAGSRIRPDGRVLKWTAFNLADNRQGSLPFFIEWSADSVHPSVDAPKGCRLERFVVGGPDPQELTKTFQLLGVDVPIEPTERPQLRARIFGPKGTMEVAS